MHKSLLPHLKSLLTILALSLSLLTNAQTHGGDGIVYVKPAPTGIGDGSSWENATADLHSAIHIDGVQKVFVAVGEYKVGSNSFVMKNNVAIYGGFDPGNGITDLSHNRIMPSADNTLGSVLDGENVRPVIWNIFTSATAMNNTAILDGFSITGGSYSNGAGIRNIYASPMLSNLVIRNNSATVTGAGIYNAYSNPLVSNTLICANTVSHSSPSPSIIYGAGMYNTNSSAPVLTNTTIVGNILKSSGVMGGAGIYNDNSSSPKIYNSIFWNNQINYNSGSGGADEEGADIESSGATFILKNSITQTYDTGNSADNNKINVNPLFRSATDFRLEIVSPAINAGSSALYAELNADTKELAGNYRLDGSEVDMGAYEYQLVPDATSIVYVKPAATGTGYGNSWDNATADLQRAINTRGVQKVFVATGNYNAPAGSFVMKNGVAIYGGFDPENNIKTLDDRILPSLTVSGSVLNGENSKRVIYNNFTSATALDDTAVLDGFTITGGNTADGGGIYNKYASPVLNNLVFNENTATGNGGGIYNSNSAPSISNSIFKNNSANRGGAIFNGISSATIVISNVTITGNTAYQGGGILNENASAVTLINIKLKNNTVSGSGSAMYSFNSSTTVSNAEVTGNTGNNGIVQNNTGNTTLNNVTIANNGTYAMNIQNGGTVNINNAIVFGTLNGTGYTKQYSFIKGNTDTSTGNITTTGITVNDVFTNPSSDDYTLKQNSPAINKGSNALYAGLDANSKDLTENPRLVGTTIDLGAYESPIVLAHTAGIIYVNADAQGAQDGSSWENATADLHNAIHTDGVQKVFVAVGEYKVGSNSFVMKNNVEIYGGFDPGNGITDLSHNRILPAVTPGIVEGSVLNGEGARPVIRNQFTSATAMDNTAVLDGFTIQNGYTTGYGGGISNTYASPTLRNLVVKNNKGDWGAGLSTSYGGATVTNCIFTGNVALYSGGAILNSSDPGTLAVAVFTNCIIMGNTAGTGGGISNSRVSSTFINCAVTGNTATSSVKIGGVYNYASSTIVFINSTIANNGGHTNSYVTSGSSTLQNSIVWDNINGSYNASYSLILNNNNTSNGNIDATGLVTDDIFTNPTGGDYTLKENSLAIDAGEEGFYAGLDENTKDLTGNARIYGFNGGGRIDLGAYESSYNVYPYITLTPTSGIIYVKETASGLKNGSSWDNATNNLKRAIRIAGVQQVYTAIGNYPANYIVMKNNVAVYGGFDPDNGIEDLTDTRIVPNPDAGIEGSVVNGLNTKAIVWNNNNSLDNTAILDGFTLTDGRSTTGGGIYNNGASPTLSNLWIKGNTATSDGGGMYNTNSSSPVMANVTISNNTANYGGGIFNRNNSSPVMRNVYIKANTSTNDGGGMYNDVSASPVLTNVSITGNTAKNGAGMYNRGNSSPTLVNTLIANNTANANGGAIRNETSSSPLLTNVTIANNTGLNALYAIDGSTSLTNSIIYGSITGSYTAQYSLAQGNSSTANGNLDATGITLAQIFVNPTTGDYTLSNSSPATDAGDNTLIPLDVTTDLAGNARIQKGTVDLGAYERAYNPDPDDDGIIYVKTNATGNGSGNSWDNAMDNLQDAINTNNVLKVFVAKGTYDIPSTSSFIMKEGVKIYGGFDPDQNIKTLENDRILPDASNPDNDIQGTVLNGKNQRTVISNRDNGLTAAALLDGFTIMNGQGSDGGGIYNYYVSPAYSNLVIRNNTAVYGGGVYITSSNPVFTHVSIINNTATTNGGGMKISASAPEISNSLISGNTAPYGGGVFNSGANGTASAFTNVVITGNQATETTDQDNSGGGGIYNSFADLVLTNVVISNNGTKFQGGGIRNLGGNPVLTNVSLANNTAEANYEAIAIVEGMPKINNSIIYGTIGGAYTAQNSLIQGNTDFSKGNLDATDIILTDIFTNESTGDYTLSEYSPAIDKGDNTLYVGLDGNTKDLAGNARVFKFTDGRKIDLGAYEYQGDLAPLPVTLIDFTAKAEGKRAMLQWQTAKETDNAKFIIYRSADGKEFVQIGELPGNGTSILNSNYVFYDYSPLNGNNYYQLVQVDQNGKASELAIKNLNFGFQILDIQLYPNPTQDYFTVSFEAGRFSQLELVDINGKVMQRETINSIENSKTLSIAIYPAGIYMVKLGGKGQVESRKVIKK